MSIGAARCVGTGGKSLGGRRIINGEGVNEDLLCRERISAIGRSCESVAVLDEFHSCGGGIDGGRKHRSGWIAISGKSADLSRTLANSRVLGQDDGTYLMVDKGDRMDRSLILLLGVTARARPALLETDHPEVLVHPDEESEPKETAESEFDNVLILPGELVSLTRCVHSSPHPLGPRGT